VKKGHIVTSTFQIPEVRESRGRGDLVMGKPKRESSESIWRKPTFRHIGVRNFGSYKDKRAKHFSVGKPEIAKGGESRETRNFGILEIVFLGSPEDRRLAICIEKPKRGLWSYDEWSHGPRL
jgi:hypothetical protein